LPAERAAETAGAGFLRRLENQPLGSRSPGKPGGPDQNGYGQPGEPTSPYQSGGTSAGAPAAPVQVALGPASGGQPASELQALLKKRLLIVAFIFLGGGVIGLPATLLGPSGGWLAFTVLAVTDLGVVATITPALWKRAPSLRTLRAIELFLFGIPVLG